MAGPGHRARSTSAPSTDTAESLELAVSAAASIVTARSRQRDLVRLVTTDGTDSGFAAGHAHVEAIMEHLAVVHRSRSASLHPILHMLKRGAGGALLAILANPTDADIDALVKLRGRFGLVTIVLFEQSSWDPAWGTQLLPPRLVPAPAAPGVRVLRITAQEPFVNVWNQAVTRPAPTPDIVRRTSGREPGRMSTTGETIGRPAGGIAARSLQLPPVVVAEVALALLTIATIAGFSRLYQGASFFLPLATLAVAGHALAATCRRRRLALPVVAVIAVVAGAVLIVWLFFGRTTVLGMPTLHTIDVADAALRHAWSRFGVVVAPAPALPGFQLVAATAIWAGVWFADWAAFRVWAAAESVAPAAVLFIFGSMLGAPRYRVGATVLFAAAVLAFMLVHRIARQEGVGTWIATSPGAGRRAVLRAGSASRGSRSSAGRSSAPHIAGRRPQGPSCPGGRAQATTALGITVSPLVDIRKRLVNQSNEEAFNVRSNRPSYWRLTSLDTFDGRIWSSGGSFGQARGSLSSTMARPAGRRQITQEFEIAALSAIWVPAAFEATSVDPGDTQMRWDPDSSTLIVDDNQTTSDGFNYTVVSDVPQFTRPASAGPATRFPETSAGPTSSSLATSTGRRLGWPGRSLRPATIPTSARCSCRSGSENSSPTT